MRYLSVCSGIEAASVAWKPLGWECAAVAEIDPFPAHVLAHRQRATAPMFMPDPDAPGLSNKERRSRANAIKAMSTLPVGGVVPNYGDLTRFKEWPEDDKIDLIVGGTPCQSFSVAGLRRGLKDPRGNLALTFLGVVDKYRPRWVVWENVPGVLSSNSGRDFGSFLGALGQIGYGWSYRVLDAQYVRTCGQPFAVPQRRRRVFVVGYLGDWRPAAAALFDAGSLRGNPPPRRKAGQSVAGSLAARTRGGGGLGTDFEVDGGLVAHDVAPTLNAHFGEKQGLEDQHVNGGCGHFVAHALLGEGFDASEDGTGRGTPLVPVAIQERAVSQNPDAGPDGVGVRQDGAAYTLEARSSVQAVAFDCKGTEVQFSTDGSHPTLRSMGHNGSHQNAGGHAAVATPWAVRRLSCRECERLQGFPDDYTDVPYRGRNVTPDGPRYKALGNSMAVNVMEWIGERIALVEGNT